MSRKGPAVSSDNVQQRHKGERGSGGGSKLLVAANDTVPHITGPISWKTPVWS